MPGPACQVRNSIGALNQWPDGQRIRTLSMGPLVEGVVSRSQNLGGKAAPFSAVLVQVSRAI
jgi:hypothetical protein